MIERLLTYLRKRWYTPEQYAKYLGVKIGSGCNIQDVNFGSEPYLVTVGNDVQITSGTKIFTHGGGWIFRKENPKLDYFGKVVLKDNIYIGNNCLIMPGVTIGSGVIVGSGSVVTKSIPDGKIAVGNPARVIGEAIDYYAKIKQFDVSSKGMSYEDKKRYLLSLGSEKFIKK